MAGIQASFANPYPKGPSYNTNVGLGFRFLGFRVQDSGLIIGHHTILKSFGGSCIMNLYLGTGKTMTMMIMYIYIYTL